MADCLRHAGTVEVTEDIRSSKWMKLVVNAAEFLPTAILGLPDGRRCGDPGDTRCHVSEARAQRRCAPLSLWGISSFPIFGKSRVEVNDPEAYAKSLMDEVLSHWTLPDTRVAVFAGLDERPPWRG